jgi:uncharacterized SAM-binding protein YcdF (DUF218 family)
MKKKYGLGCGCGLAFVIVVVILTLLLELAGPLLVHRDALHPTDAIVILSGGGEERLEYGAKLVNDKLTRQIILTETGDQTNSGTDVTAANRSLLSSRYGILQDNVTYTRKTSTNTYEEAQAVAELMKRKGWTSLIVVTDSFHSLRTSLLFHKVMNGKKISVSVQPVDVADYWYHPWRWWLTSESRQATILEITKVIAFYFGTYQ